MSTKEYMLDRINSNQIFKHFERDYSLFFISTWGKSHTEILNSPQYGDGAITLVLGVFANNMSQYYRLASDNEKLIDVVGDKMIANAGLRNEIFQNYIKYGEAMLALFEEIKQHPTVDSEFIKKLALTCTNLVGYQILLIHRTDSYEKKFKDYPEIPEEIHRLRKKYESAFGLFETHFEMMCQQLLQERKDATLNELKLLTVDEFLVFIESDTLPTNIPERRQLTIVSHIPQTEYFFGAAAQPIEKAIRDNEEKFQQRQLNDTVIRGQTVYGKGTIVGTCQLITDYEEVKNLAEGNILVTPSTLPKYNHIYPRAKAIVTDEGGVLAHAAIFCREQHIPGIIGTKVATKVIRNGNKIELNLDSGTVNIL